jgi:hypothetical protein
MAVSCVQRSRRWNGYVAGMTCDRYVAELPDDELLPGDDHDFLVAIVRIPDLHTDPGDFFFQVHDREHPIQDVPVRTNESSE